MLQENLKQQILFTNNVVHTVEGRHNILQTNPSQFAASAVATKSQTKSPIFTFVSFTIN